jgi:hypothetical protein
MQKGIDSMETVTMGADLELFKNDNSVCWSFRFLNAMCPIGSVAGWDGDRVDINALRGWNIQQLSGLTFSEKSVESAYIEHVTKSYIQSLKVGPDHRRTKRMLWV